MRRKIAYWEDGDSGVDSKGRRFRLARVRAPEKTQRGASKATRTIAGMTGRSRGYVSTRKVGTSYGRDVVEMWNRDGSINNRMRKKGYKNKGR